MEQIQTLKREVKQQQNSANTASSLSKLSPKREDKRKIKNQKTANKQRTKKIGLTKKSTE